MNKLDFSGPAQGVQHNTVIGGACEPEKPISAHRIHTHQTVRTKGATWGAGRHICEFVCVY